MAEVATLARPYAEAVFELARDSGELDAWSRMLAYLTTAASDATLADYLDGPIPAAEKAKTLVSVCGDELNDLGKRFVRVLADYRRLDLLVEIYAQFETLKALAEQTLDVEVISARALSSDQEAALASSLAKRFKREIELVSRVDETLIGGAVIRTGDTVIDGSVRGKLNKLAEGVLR